MITAVNANEVIIRGHIVHIYEAPKATIITISTGKFGDVVNYPKVILFGELREAAKKYQVHDNIKVTCNIQSSRREKDNKEFFSQALFAESIEDAPKELEEEFGIKGSKPAPPINDVKIAGEVQDIFTPRKNLVKLVVRTRKNNRISFVKVSYYTKDVGKVMDEIRVRDNVCGVGKIQTSRIEFKDETKYLETVVLRDLQKVS